MTRSLWALHSQMCRGEKDGGRANKARPNLCLSIKDSQLHPFSSFIICFFFSTKSRGRRSLMAHHAVRQRIMNQRNALGYSRSGHGNRQVPVISTNNSKSFRPKRKSNEDTDSFYTATRRKWQSGPLSHHAWICEGTLRHNQGSDALSNSEIGSSD